MTVYCPECGEDNRDNAKFCHECGADLSKNNIKTNDNKGVSDSKKFMIAALIVVLACLIMFILAFLVFNQS